MFKHWKRVTNTFNFNFQMQENTISQHQTFYLQKRQRFNDLRHHLQLLHFYNTELQGVSAQLKLIPKRRVVCFEEH